MVGVPVIEPELGSTARPGGSEPPSEKVSGDEPESVAETVTGMIADPDSPDWSPGPVTDTALETVQVNEVLPL